MMAHVSILGCVTWSAKSTGSGSICGDATVLGEAEETELWSETIEGGETSEKEGEVKGVSTGRFKAGRV